MQSDVLRRIHLLSNLLSFHCGYNPPKTLYDMIECVKKVNGKVVEHAKMDITTDGMMAKTVDNRFLIIIPKLMTADKKIVYIAKGIGHAFLHMGYDLNRQSDQWTSIQSGKTYKFDMCADVEAFEFAHVFLQDGKNKYKFGEDEKSVNQFEVGKDSGYEDIRIKYESVVAERDRLIQEEKDLRKQYLAAKQTDVAQKILKMSEEEKRYIIEHTEHSRSSCSDDNPCNGLYSTEHNGKPGFRCPKCMLMEILRGDYGGKYDFRLSFDIFEVEI